jgi:hypothetical protein
MSTFLRRGFTLFLLFLAAALLHPVDTTAQNLPGWAEPSEQRESRFDRQKFKNNDAGVASRSHDQAGDDLANSPDTGFPGPITNKQGRIAPGECEPSCSSDEYCYQPGNSGNGNNSPKCYTKGTGPAPGQGIPVDDYLPLLLLAGIAYAAIRLRQ